MFKRLLGFLSTDIAIDLGTANTLVFMPKKGIVLDQPTVVAIRQGDAGRSIAAVGTEAKQMLGRTPMGLSAIRPLKDGVIADLEMTEVLLVRFLQKIQHKPVLKQNLRVLVSVPCKATLLERRAIKEAADGAGANEIRLIDRPMAAALGAGLPVDTACGSMIVDIGAGTTEIAVISLLGSVYSDSIRTGGDVLNERIVTYIRRQYGCLIGETTAEHIKQELGMAMVLDEQIPELEVRGRHLSAGVPTAIKVNAQEISTALQEPLRNIVNAIKNALEDMPAELSADIAERGIMLTGGTALLRHLDKFLLQEVGLPVIVAEEPLTCVIRGMGQALAYLDNPAYDSLFVH
ncbi:rod shape-determining protein [Agitococcus lubricus]|uniref:Cell shape-determining protein MreB n=1 Tax=Agitococcus lubricus TaxID=1077255 RepID=A0A2T5ITT4_9GAMM|nr:rod shape-determining protein MreB [Agitococcus lubricus]